VKFYIFSHTPFHHLQVCQILANSENDILEDKIKGLNELPYAKLLIDGPEELFDILSGLPGISVQDQEKPLDI
jgi:hypothetical protein